MSNIYARVISGLVPNKAQRHKVREVLISTRWNSGFDLTMHMSGSNNKHPSLLALLCDKYGTDKGEVSPHGHPYSHRSHHYHEVYDLLWSQNRNHIIRVFECGIGTNNPDKASNMGERGKPGASLKMWREYFPNAMIFGADIDRDILFQEERIKTHYIDQLSTDAIRDYWEWAGNDPFDIMIDDGLHTFEAARSLFENSIHRLADNGLYIIEDMRDSDIKEFWDYFSESDYRVRVSTWRYGDTLLIVDRPQGI